MNATVTRYGYVAQFQCLGPDCPDTCCQGWSMPVDRRQEARYAAQAPELLAAIDRQEHAMRREPEQDRCVKLTDGLCGIHRDYGSDYLGDSCHFYPRIVRSLAGEPMMAATLSCPEIARLALTMNDPFAPEKTTIARLPLMLAQPVPPGLSAAEAQAIMAGYLALAGDATYPPEQNILRVLREAAALETSILPVFAPSDPQALLYALMLLMAFGTRTQRPRLMQTIAAMEQALDCRIDWPTREIVPGKAAGSAMVRLGERWSAHAAETLAPMLRRWLQTQLTMMAFPFGGFPGTRLQDRAAILGVRFATVKLALMCHVAADGTPPELETVLRVVQSLSRFMDHLADAELSLMIYRDAGWLNPARLAGVILQRSDF